MQPGGGRGCLTPIVCRGGSSEAMQPGDGADALCASPGSLCCHRRLRLAAQLGCAGTLLLAASQLLLQPAAA